MIIPQGKAEEHVLPPQPRIPDSPPAIFTLVLVHSDTGITSYPYEPLYSCELNITLLSTNFARQKVGIQ